jgi:CHAP domain.
MSFVPRLDAPPASSPYWKTTGSGGYNKCINISGGSVLPNCVGYAYGRFMEIMNATSCNLSTHNAGLWYGNTSDGYTRSDKPQLGAVVCWSRPGEAGHVAIVEQINADGSIVTSNSAYGGKRFYTQTLSPPGYTWSGNYHLQGFICNPSVSSSTTGTTTGNASKLYQFINCAKSQIGKKQEMGKRNNWLW